MHGIGSQIEFLRPGHSAIDQTNLVELLIVDQMRKDPTKKRRLELHFAFHAIAEFHEKQMRTCYLNVNDIPFHGIYSRG